MTRPTTAWRSPSSRLRDGDNKLEYGGELKAMAFQAKLLQHDPSLRAVLLAPWTYTRVENADGKRCI